MKSYTMTKVKSPRFIASQRKEKKNSEQFSTFNLKKVSICIEVNRFTAILLFFFFSFFPLFDSSHSIYCCCTKSTLKHLSRLYFILTLIFYVIKTFTPSGFGLLLFSLMSKCEKLFKGQKT